MCGVCGLRICGVWVCVCVVCGVADDVIGHRCDGWQLFDYLITRSLIN